VSAIAALAVLWLLYRLRVGRVASNLSARFDERLAERTRLARELHDTLLQTIQGSKMVADTLSQSNDATRLQRGVEQLSVWLAQAVQEGRAALNSLRNSTIQENDLAEAFRLAADSTLNPGIDVALSVSGKPVDMHPIVRDEIYHIGYEALRNAFMHSNAAHVSIELRYDKEVTLRVADDGVGIAQEIIERGRPGHYGLQGMRERAARIKASLTLLPSTTGGTVMTLIVPGSVVYRRS